MTHIKQNVEQLNSMIKQGKILDAFDRYYSDNIVMQENNKEPRRGKEENRKYEEQFVNNVKEFHNAEVKHLAVNEDENVSMVEWSMEMTFKDGNRSEMNQVAVQTWDGDKIVHERFYYNS